VVHTKKILSEINIIAEEASYIEDTINDILRDPRLAMLREAATRITVSQRKLKWELERLLAVHDQLKLGAAALDEIVEAAGGAAAGPAGGGGASGSAASDSESGPDDSADGSAAVDLAPGGSDASTAAASSSSSGSSTAGEHTPEGSSDGDSDDMAGSVSCPGHLAFRQVERGLLTS
jgi:hypothetical protein